MSNLELLSGLVGSAASEPLGVPDGYGFICAGCWIVMTLIALFALPGQGALSAADVRARGREDKSPEPAPVA